MVVCLVVESNLMDVGQVEDWCVLASVKVLFVLVGARGRDEVRGSPCVLDAIQQERIEHTCARLSNSTHG